MNTQPYEALQSKNVIYKAMNDLTGKNEIIDIEVAELPKGTLVNEMFYQSDGWVTVPGYELYADGNGGLVIMYDED